MKVRYKLCSDDNWYVGILTQDSTFSGGFKITDDKRMNIFSISIIDDFKMFK